MPWIVLVVLLVPLSFGGFLLWHRVNSRSIDERFTNVADDLSDLAGRWPHALFWLVLIIFWLGLGPLMHFSDSWQLMANTPTTLIELFLGIMATAAANRLERRHRTLQEAQYAILKELRSVLDGVQATVSREEIEIAGEEKEIEGIRLRLIKDETPSS